MSQAQAPKKPAGKWADPLRNAEESYATAIAFGRELAHVLWDYDNHLIYLREQIRLAQPRTHGAVLLELERCGRGCIGCPHPRWVKWVNRNQQSAKAAPTWFGTRIQSPGRSARAKTIPQEARDLIADAQDVVRKRESLLEAVRRLRQVLSGHKRFNPDLGS